MSAEDVGEEFVDVAARAANGRKLEQRLIDILGTRTGKLSDVLAVERELARVREDIQRQEGRMRYLRTRASLSTLSVTVHEKDAGGRRARGAAACSPSVSGRRGATSLASRRARSRHSERCFRSGRSSVRPRGSCGAHGGPAHGPPSLSLFPGG